MAKVGSWAGLDVHAAKVVAATVDGESGALAVVRLSGVTEEVVAFCAGLPGPVKVAYEAGPTGFGLARAAARMISSRSPAGQCSCVTCRSKTVDEAPSVPGVPGADVCSLRYQRER
jgi:hypothetical protein